MKKLIIYIDYYNGIQEIEFAKKLKERLNIIKLPFEVILFSDLRYDVSADLKNWEAPTLKAISDANIVIPLLTENYLGVVTPNIESSFDEIFLSIDRYLLPIYLTPSDWSSFNWIVKSKLTPSENKPLSEYPADQIDLILADLIKTINIIITKYYSNSLHKKENKENLFSEEQKIVFISHDHEDADFAELLKLKLKEHNIVGWIDSERLKIGQDWREEIDFSITNSIAVIAIMTPEARKSEYVTYEWAFAWGKGIKIFPLMVKQTQLHPRLESLQYLDFTNRASRPWVNLIESIKELL